MLKAEADKPREGVCLCGGPNDVWEGLSGVGAFEDATCQTVFEGQVTTTLCSDPDVECGGYEGEDCEISATCAALTEDDVTFPAIIGECPDGAETGSFCELGCAEGYYMIQKSDGYCTADAGGNTASYKGANVNCRFCNTI